MGRGAGRRRGTVRERTLHGGSKALELGQGPPLLMLLMASEKDEFPRGLERWAELSAGVRAFAKHFTVTVPNAPVGIAPGSSMSDIAARYGDAIARDVGEPVFLHGVSTGGSVALQLAIDRPSLVRRLVLAGTACRLSEAGRSITAQSRRLIEAGDYRRAGLLWGEMVSRPLRYPTAAVGWLLGPGLVPDDPSSSLATMAADEANDAEPHLGRVTAPTLVIGAERDVFYPPDLVRLTADGIPEARAVVFPGKSHAYAVGSRASSSLALGFFLAG